MKPISLKLVFPNFSEKIDGVEIDVKALEKQFSEVESKYPFLKFEVNFNIDGDKLSEFLIGSGKGEKSDE